MKVVLFCGGQGMRIRDYSDQVPKPMVPIGRRPVLWHLMKYYAYYGHTDFILALGYRGEAIKRFFLEYEEAVTNDFVLTNGGRDKKLLGSDLDEWTITFVDTGLRSEIGERLRAVREHIGDDDLFLANYADGLTDMDLNAHIEEFESSGAVASFLAVRPPLSYHVVSLNGDGVVGKIGPMADADLWLNGGFFVFRREIFDYIGPGEDLVGPPFQRLLAEGRLRARRSDDWWQPMDTFKDQQILEALFEEDRAPWMVWRKKSPT